MSDTPTTDPEFSLGELALTLLAFLNRPRHGNSSEASGPFDPEKRLHEPDISRRVEDSTLPPSSVHPLGQSTE